MWRSVVVCAAKSRQSYQANLVSFSTFTSISSESLDAATGTHGGPHR